MTELKKAELWQRLCNQIGVNPSDGVLLTMADLSALLELSIRQVRRYVSQGQIPQPIKLSHKIHRWMAPAIVHWLSEAAKVASTGSKS